MHEIFEGVKILVNRQGRIALTFAKAIPQFQATGIFLLL